jgi:hypothetical protein
MIDFLRKRSSSLSMLILILLLISLLQLGMSFSLTFGRLGARIRVEDYTLFSGAWLAIKLVLVVLTFALWILNRKRDMFRLIIITNSVLTVGLIVSLWALTDVLTGVTQQSATTLLRDVAFLAASNIFIFSIWYWIIDPPGVDESHDETQAWDFLFPQRVAPIPHYETWVPGYVDYLYVAFTTSFAFSPTDTMPLTRRAKLLMLLQSAISIVTLTVVAGSAVGLLAGSSSPPAPSSSP